ncbi:hypothetical protein [Streptomyces griseus]|uniref:hypothetical protein n=1 Tax=Streptomyces griseus TaxID=1911 RepID=UPI0038024E5C
MKGLQHSYRPGARGWSKVRARESTEAVIGAITGTLGRPRLLVLGRYDSERRLRHVGKTTDVCDAAARQLAGQLTAASPGTRPWEGTGISAGWGTQDVIDTTLVVPDRVAEVSVDTARDRGVWRHPIRLVRWRAPTRCSHFHQR